jgi:hypothetical protein
VLPAVLLLTAVAVLPGCSGGSDPRGPSAEQRTEADGSAVGTAERSGTPRSVDCPGTATPVDLPQGFPAPLPTGTVVVAVQQRDGGRTVVTGVVPAPEDQVLKELQRVYPAAGLRLVEGETEEHDAESNFTGDGALGRWGVRALADCSPVATRIDLVAARL